ncbi:DUF887-domain-containing protein [Wallemia mellicola]|uniref:DUF887-domain-containing protein n=1 Tax=Wallemia mellicola TaxID=1708541 RepID=A0A4T0PTL8_9BASI|nr:DUF887-domain-containing protein [Wallemia mellicola]TIC32556.1 DUF887-domain-containing protein [Wallemia mellicola]
MSFVGLLPRHFSGHLPPFTVCFIGCFGVSAISHLISERYLSATYEKLDKNQKLDWNAHTVSLVHSLLIAPAAGYALYKSPIALTDTLYGYDSLIGNIHAFSLGYFLWDALHDVRTRQPVYLVHALVSFSAYLWTFRPVFMNIGPSFLLWEASTPFVNINWFMDRIEGYKNSRSQIVNGIALTLSFFTARIAFGGYMSYIFYKTIVEHQNSFPKSLAAVYVAGNITLNILNLNWFYKMIKKIKRMYSRL